MEAASCVNDGNVGTLGLCGLKCIVRYGCRICSLSLLNQLNAGPFRPHFKLLVSSSPEGIRGADHNPITSLTVVESKFANRCCFPSPVYTDHHDHIGAGLFRKAQRIFRRRAVHMEDAGDFVLQKSRQLGRVFIALLFHPVLNAVEKRLRCGHTYIGLNENLFKSVEQFLVDPRFCEGKMLNLLKE